MSTPGNPELRQPSNGEIIEFNRLVLPYANFGDQERAAELLSELPEPDRLLYRTIFRTFEDDQTFADLTADGSFTRLTEFARSSAQRISEGYPLTLPKAFAVHSIASVTASVFRAPPERYEQSNDRTSYFLTQFATRLAIETPRTALEDAADPYLFLQAVSKRMGRLAQVGDETPAWITQKGLLLSDRMLLRKHMLEMVEQEDLIEVDDFNALKSNNDELFQELKRLRRFTVKSAVHEGTSSHWSIHDLSDIREQQAEEANNGIRPEQWLPDMVLIALEHQFEELATSKVVTDASTRPNYEQFKRQVFMDNNGQLFCDQYGAMPLYTLYEQAGKVENYEVLRQFLMQEYYDLTVPLKLVTEAGEQTNVFLQGRNVDEDRDNGVVYHDLLLPRIRSLRRKTVGEINDLENEDRQAARRRQRSHDRVGHIRILSPGHRPSEKARGLAAADNVEIPDGYTYEKESKRGDIQLGRVEKRVRKRKDGGSEE